MYLPIIGRSFAWCDTNTLQIIEPEQIILVDFFLAIAEQHLQSPVVVDDSHGNKLILGK